MQTLPGESVASSVQCLFYKAVCEWNLGEIALYQATKAEMISLAKELNNMNTFAFALYVAAISAGFERNLAEIERFAAELIEISIRYNFAFPVAKSSGAPLKNLDHLFDAVSAMKTLKVEAERALS